MAIGFMIDTSRQTYGVWKFGWLVEGSAPFQAWILPPPYVYIPVGLSADEAMVEQSPPDSVKGSLAEGE